MSNDYLPCAKYTGTDMRSASSTMDHIDDSRLHSTEKCDTVFTSAYRG